MDPAQAKAYDRDDILPPIRSALSVDGAEYAIPFYGESSMLFYRKDLFRAAGTGDCPRRRPGIRSTPSPRN